MEEHKTPRYQIIPGADGNRFRFFCDLSGAVLCTTGPIRAATAEEELKIAWETEGRAHFNRCHKCGRWVDNVMYNADRLECVDCAPWLERPRYCTACGAKLGQEDTACPVCGAPIMGGGRNEI